MTVIILPSVSTDTTFASISPNNTFIWPAGAKLEPLIVTWVPPAEVPDGIPSEVVPSDELIEVISGTAAFAGKGNTEKNIIKTKSKDKPLFSNFLPAVLLVFM